MERSAGNFDEEDLDSIGDLSERTVTRMQRSNDQLVDALRRDSFSSISSMASRQKYVRAVDDISSAMKNALGGTVAQLPPPSRSVRLTPLIVDLKEMDSPPDQSPNAPPFDSHAQYFGQLNKQNEAGVAVGDGPGSTEGSVDSSGFEKVEHDLLEEYGQRFAAKPSEDRRNITTSMSGSHQEHMVDTPEPASHQAPQHTTDSHFSSHGDEIDVKPADIQPVRDDIVIPPQDNFEHNYDTNQRQPGDLYDYSHPYHEPEHVHPVEPEVRHDSPESPQHVPEVPHYVSESPQHVFESPQHESVVPELIPESSHDYPEAPHHVPESVPHVVPETEFHNYEPEPIQQHLTEHHEPAPYYQGNDLLGDFEPVNTRPRELDEHEKVKESLGDFHERAIDSPKVHHEPSHVDQQEHSSVNDFLDSKARELVNEAVASHEHDHIHHGGHTEEDVEDVHDEVADMVRQMQNNDRYQEAETNRRSPSPPSSDLPDFRSRTPEDEPYERHGPLTIPEQPIGEQEEDLLGEMNETDVNDLPPPAYDAPHFHSGFEREPRPPTPPKELSDEEVKPSVVDLGHGTPAHTPHSEPNRSILKHRTSSYSGGGQPWFDCKTVDPKVLEVIYWRDPKKSAIALSLALLAIFILAKFPLLSVLAYTGLAVLGATLGFRLYKAAEAQIKKTPQENPFQEILGQDLSLPQDRVHAQVDVLAEHANVLANNVKKVVFVENIVDSVKFGLLLWSLTYVASWFSGFAIVVLVVLGVFSIPKVYEVYQEPIDEHLGVVKGHLNNVQNILEEKLPFLKRAEVVEEKKEQ